MQTLILNILATDIKNSDYMVAEDCAITMALARAGRKDLKDRGTDIGFKDWPHDNFISTQNPSYKELSKKVSEMYLGNLKPEDFTHTLTY